MDSKITKVIEQISLIKNISTEEVITEALKKVFYKNTRPLVVGLTGKIGSGKTYVAGGIKKNLKNIADVEIESMAKPLRRLLMEMTKASDYTEAKKEVLFPELTGRGFLQLLGTEVGRNLFYEDIWVNAFTNRVNKNTTANIIVVDDIRYPNEAEVCDLVINVISHSKSGHKNTPEKTHESERAEVRWDIQYINETQEIACALTDKIYDAYINHITAIN